METLHYQPLDIYRCSLIPPPMLTSSICDWMLNAAMRTRGDYRHSIHSLFTEESIFAACLTEVWVRFHRCRLRLNQVHKVTALKKEGTIKKKTQERNRAERKEKVDLSIPSPSDPSPQHTGEDIFGLNVFSGAPKNIVCPCLTPVCLKIHFIQVNLKQKHITIQSIHWTTITASSIKEVSSVSFTEDIPHRRQNP